MELSEIYAQYHGKISKYLARIVGHSEAEDLAQEVFIKIGNSLNTLQDPSRLSVWVFEIALNAAKDRIRHNSSIKSGKDLLMQLQAEEGNDDPLSERPDERVRTPEEILEYTSMVECYLGFVKQLPKTQYDVYVFGELEGLSDKEIAERMSLPLSTVKMRLHRARTRLYKELRTNCRCYRNERGELMGDRKSISPPKPFKA